MPREHITRPGESLASIANRYGFPNAAALYEHPENAPLRRRRPNPNLLHPGDVVAIPDREVREVTCATEQTHRLRVHVAKKKIMLRLADPGGEALANEPYELQVGDQVRFGETTEDGEIEEEVRADVAEAVLTIQLSTYRLAIGDLNPIRNTADEGISGIQARLRNLGFHPGPVDGKLGPSTRYALAAFQDACDLRVTGGLDSETIDALEDRHGG